VGDTKDILFVCVHNSGRSRMAEAFFNEEMKKRGVDEYRAISAGTAPSDHANPAVIAAMASIGISVPDTPGRLLTPELSTNAVKFISMGCGDADACPMRLRSDMEDWDVTDPKGKSVEEVAEIREVVRHRVLALIEALNIE
jgi:arsenate reductase (thioredoxin)